MEANKLLMKRVCVVMRIKYNDVINFDKQYMKLMNISSHVIHPFCVTMFVQIKGF